MPRSTSRSAPHGFARSDRVAEQLHRDLSILIRERLNDPRVATVTLLEVNVSKDLSHAKVWFDILEAEHGKEAEKVLNNATGFLRHELGRGLKLRITPGLRFFYDDTQVRAQSLSALIDQVVAVDRANHVDDAEPASDADKPPEHVASQDQDK